MKSSRLALGIVKAAVIFFLLYLVPSYLIRQLVPGGLGQAVLPVVDYFFSSEVLALGIMLAVLSGGATALSGGRPGGAVTVLYGIVLVAYYYLLLHGGSVLLPLSFAGISLTVEIGLTILLYLLLLSGALKAIQGVLQVTGR